MLLLWSADSFSHFFSKTSVRNTIRMSSSLDPDSVGPDLGPKCLQRLSADTEVAASKERVRLVILTVSSRKQ